MRTIERIFAECEKLDERLTPVVYAGKIDEIGRRLYYN